MHKSTRKHEEEGKEQEPLGNVHEVNLLSRLLRSRREQTAEEAIHDACVCVYACVYVCVVDVFEGVFGNKY